MIMLLEIMLHLTALFNIQNKPYSFVLLFAAVMLRND